MTSMLDRYIASMVLSGVGDAMGFKNGRWEFCMDGRKIHEEMEKLGGVDNLCLKGSRWKVSDDTVMQLATGDALVEHGTDGAKESLYLKTAYYYKECMNDMRGRSAGNTCRGGAYALQPHLPNGYLQPFDERGGGCGAAMRAMCIGLRYPNEADLDDLVSYAIESGRMTHHNPTGYLGALAAALFVSYSIQSKPVREWGAGLMSTLPKAMTYIELQGRYVNESKRTWYYFENSWKEYLKLRGITDGQSDPKFPVRYDVEERDEFYKSVSFDGWGGASGHDAPMIAYDALLGSGDCWVELCKRAMLHGGDNDSTGVMAGAWFGALYGFRGVSKHNYKNLEYRKRLTEMAINLYQLNHTESEVSPTFIEACDLAIVEEEDELAKEKAKKQRAAEVLAASQADMEANEQSVKSKVKFFSQVAIIPEPTEPASEEANVTSEVDQEDTKMEIERDVKQVEVSPNDGDKVADNAEVSPHDEKVDEAFMSQVNEKTEVSPDGEMADEKTLVSQKDDTNAEVSPHDERAGEVLVSHDGDTIDITAEVSPDGEMPLVSQNDEKVDAKAAVSPLVERADEVLVSHDGDKIEAKAEVSPDGETVPEKADDENVISQVEFIPKPIDVGPEQVNVQILSEVGSKDENMDVSSDGDKTSD